MTTRSPAKSLWQWRLLGAVLVGMAEGFLAARALGWNEASVQSAIVAGFTAVAGSRGRLSTSLPVAGIVGGIVVLYSTIGALTTGYPWAAAVAMAVVAFTTSVMAAARPVGLLVGMLASYAYFLVTGVGVIEDKYIGQALGDIGVLGLIGLAAGLIVVTIRALIEQAIHTAPPPTTRSSSPSLLAPMITSVRTFDGHAKDGVRRALALGVAMFAFQSIADHGAFWVMLTVFVILQPSGRTPLRATVIRVSGTFVGVMAVVVIAPLVPKDLALPLGVLCLAVSLAVSTRSSTLSAAFGAACASVLAGLPHDDIVGYAGARLLDTLVGAALALAAGYLLWPASTPTDVVVPDDLAGDASETGVATQTR